MEGGVVEILLDTGTIVGVAGAGGTDSVGSSSCCACSACGTRDAAICVEYPAN